MSRGLQDLGFGEKLGLLGSAFRGNIQPFQAASQQARQRQQQQQLAGILSGQQTPAFARPGGAEFDPQQFRQGQISQLGALGTPQAIQAMTQLSPFVSPLEERKVGLEERRIAAAERDIQRKEEAALRQQDLLQELLGGQGVPTRRGQRVPVTTGASETIQDLKARRQQLLPALTVPGASELAKAQIASIDEEIKFERQVAKEERKQVEKLTPENAAKISLVTVGLKQLDEIEDILKDDQGNFNDSDIAAMNAKIPFTKKGGSIPFTEGRRARSLFLNAINAQLRAESGAAVPEEEVQRGFERFVPNILDSDKTKQEKLNSLRQLLKNTLEASKGPQQRTEERGDNTSAPRAQAAPPSVSEIQAELLRRGLIAAQ